MVSSQDDSPREVIDLAGSSSSDDEVEEVEGSPTKVTEKWAPKTKVEPTVLINEDTRMGVPNETPLVSGVEFVDDSLEGMGNADDPLEDFDFFEFEKKRLKASSHSLEVFFIDRVQFKFDHRNRLVWSMKFAQRVCLIN